MATTAGSDPTSNGTLIDGSVLEGGGQLMRNSVAFATLLSRPIFVNKIRDGRKPPGLKRQHAAGVKLVAEICNAETTGAQNGSRELGFRPKAIRPPSSYVADPGTAGSTTLLLQVSLPCLLFAPPHPLPEPDSHQASEELPSFSTLILRGGTNAQMAPQIDYTKNIFLPFVRRHCGLNLTLNIRRRGYHPRGGGEVAVDIHPRRNPIPAFTLLHRGEITSVTGEARVGGLPAHLARSMRDSAVERLVSYGIDHSKISIEGIRERDENVLGTGSGIVIYAMLEGGGVIAGSALGNKGTPPEQTGVTAAQDLIRGLEEGGCVDEYMQDQMIIFMALAAGKSSVLTGPISLHTRTAIWVMEQLTEAKFTIDDGEDETRIINCVGIGFNPHPSGESTII